MILTCPDCATSYFVDDARIPAKGRTVKCTNCGARWMALKETGQIPTSSDIPQSAAAPEADDVLVEGGSAAADFETLFTPVVAAKPRRSGRPPKAMVFAGVAVAVAVLAAALLLRPQVMGLWPASAGAYRAIGLGGPESGLTIAGVKAEPIFVGGRPALAVSGQIHNAGTEAQDVPPLRIRLLDKAGKAWAEKTATPGDARAPAGATRYFSVAFIDPPKGAQVLDVAFAPAKKGKAHEPAHEKAGAGAEAAPEAGHPPAPEPEEAKPLAAGSPDALDHHE